MGQRLVNVFLLLYAVVLVAFLWETSHAEDRARPSDNQIRAEELVRNLQYVKDMRTGICFAYQWKDRSLTTLIVVPCDTIPADLLIIAQK